MDIKRALISVSDKTNLKPFVQKLHETGIEIISTGGTAQVIREEGIPVTEVSTLTGFDECLDGRVKTLHPVVHAGILGRTSQQADVEEMEELDIEPIELVVANLYPFKEAVAQADDAQQEMMEIMEQIDIGGPTMVRAAAKNFKHVCVLTNSGQYDEFMNELDKEGIDLAQRQEWARQAFNHTADYDVHIANYFNEMAGQPESEQINISLPLSQELRYGENPHQQAAVYGHQGNFIDCFHGKQLSYNNYADIDAALNLISDFENDDPTCAIFKHTVPCGVATAQNLEEAWQRAFQTDTKSPFGGIIIVNKELNIEAAEAIHDIFTEIILAPSFTDEALELLQQKKKRRLVKINALPEQKRSVKSVFGGLLSQQIDDDIVEADGLETVTERKPTEDEIKNLLFAWKIVKHVKSNGIVYARDNRTIGIGTGQTSRVASSEIAVADAGKEELSLENTAIASDAFFPFADGVEAAAQAGATSAIQPGGSIRDEEVIEAANKHDMAMVFTGNRHFRH